mmetsp:Transcript_15306/g.46706  ORF Transcript_15306/g.46706 Transcript_15306/m.46706 type:complete len:206 (-) Transcript_15306:20-637(-)
MVPVRKRHVRVPRSQGVPRCLQLLLLGEEQAWLCHLRPPLGPEAAVRPPELEELVRASGRVACECVAQPLWQALGWGGELAVHVGVDEVAALEARAQGGHGKRRECGHGHGALSAPRGDEAAERGRGYKVAIKRDALAASHRGRAREKEGPAARGAEAVEEVVARRELRLAHEPRDGQQARVGHSEAARPEAVGRVLWQCPGARP